MEQDLKEQIQQIVNRALRERSRLSQGGDMEYAHLAGYMTSALEQISMILKEGA